MFSKENCSSSCPLLYLVINITDGLSRVFLNLMFYLATAVERKISILLRGLPKVQVQSETDFKLQISAQHSWSVPNLLRGRPIDLSFKTVVKFHRIDNSKKPETVTSVVWIFVQISHFQDIFDGQWWNQISTHFSDSRHQEYMIFARIGDGPCNCY